MMVDVTVFQEIFHDLELFFGNTYVSIHAMVISFMGTVQTLQLH